MFDQIPVRAWLLFGIAAAAYGPGQYAFRYIAASPSRRDITQPSVDLAWRTPGQFALNFGVLCALAALAIFIFTPAAEQFARSASFLPILMLCFAAWSLFTVPQGLVTGRVEPFLKGVSNTYERDAQPKRFWLSVAWNALLGCGCLLVAWKSYEQVSTEAIEDQCYNERKAYPPQTVISACDELIANGRGVLDRREDYLVGRGAAYYRLGDYQHAIADYSKAIQLDPSNHYAPYDRGLAYQRIGDARHAVKDFSTAIDLLPNGANAYFNRGLIFLEAGNLDGAVGDLTRAHELDPKDPWAIANRGLAYAWKKDQAHAEKDFQTVRATDPSNPVMLRGEAVLRKNAGDMQGAVDRLTESMARDPDNLWALRTRAELYWELGEQEKSAEDDRKWQELMKKARTRVR